MGSRIRSAVKERVDVLSLSAARLESPQNLGLGGDGNENESIDKIREILFGNHVREQEARSASLEMEFRKRFSALEDEFRRALESMENQIHTQLDAFSIILDRSYRVVSKVEPVRSPIGLCASAVCASASPLLMRQ